MIFSQKQLKEFAEQSCAKLLEARDGVNLYEEPFKHVFIDNFFPDELAGLCLDSFPAINLSDWDVACDVDIYSNKLRLRILESESCH